MKTPIHHYKKSLKDPRGDLVIKTGSGEVESGLALRKGLWIPALAVTLVILITTAWVNFSSRPVLSVESDFQYFEIKKGESTAEIGQKLMDGKVVRSRRAFYLKVKSNFRKPIQAGYYKLSGSMPMDEIIEKLQEGKTDAFSITIPEGYRVLQIAKLISERSNIDPNKFIEAAVGTEGTLFPDTHVFPTNFEAEKIVRKMKENHDERVKSLRPTPEQLVLASIVEREAKKDDERAKIAAVYRNRADNNMLLQADPTIRYALDTQAYLKNKSVDFTFWQSVNKNDYQNLNSPFNTYKQKGYPPAPICNPGIKSIEAAVNSAPDFGDYFYFFHDKDLQIHFSKTYQEHQEAIKKYGLPGL